jgi:hypothetical protein
VLAGKNVWAVGNRSSAERGAEAPRMSTQLLEDVMMFSGVQLALCSHVRSPDSSRSAKVKVKRLTYRYHGIRIVVAIVAVVILRPSFRCKFATSRGIQDKQKTAHEGEYKHRACQNVLRRISSDERRYQNGSDTLESLVETRQDTDALKGDGDMRRLFQFIVSVGRERNDGSVEGLEPKLICHNTRDVDGDVPPLDRRVHVP